MDPLSAAGGVASILSGIGNFIVNSNANDRAKALQDKSLKEWMNIHIPDPQEQKIALEKFVSEGKLDPKLQSAIQQDPSAFAKISTNERYNTAQNRALSELEGIGYDGGLRLQDKAALQDAMLKGQVEDRSNREGIAAEMARRGQRGSGLEVAARLQGQQAVQDRNANNSLKVAADAQNRALQAIEGAGQMANQMGAQDFSQQSAKATAADRINQFNTQNLRDVNSANVGAQNAAQQYNLQNSQNISNQNTDLSNQQQMYNKGLAQQQYDNQIKRQMGISKQYDDLSATEQRAGQIAGNTISNIGGGVAGAAAAQNQFNLMDKYFGKK